MSRKRARLFGGIQCRAGYPKTGRQQVAGIYCAMGQRSRYGKDGARLTDTPKTRAIVTLREVRPALPPPGGSSMLLSEHAQCALWLR